MDLRWKRVMVVDDDALIRTFILNSLRRMGMSDFHEFSDGSSAISAVGKVKPDLILTDIHMKPMGGLEFVRLLRGLPNNQISNTKVIFLSADASKDTVGEALPLGVTGYLVKPPSLATLQAKVEQALGA